MSVSVWADISLIWLITLALIGILPFVALFYFAVRGMRRVNELARQYLPIAVEKVEMVADKTEEICNQIANPVVKTYSAVARVRGMTRAIHVTHTIQRRND